MKTILICAILLASILAIEGCTPPYPIPEPPAATVPDGAVTTTSVTIPVVIPTPSTLPPMIAPALSWNDSTHTERKEWTGILVGLVLENFDSFDAAKDAPVFCTNYATLTKDQKINFWSEFIVWVSYYESGWNPASRMQETTMGGDPITGRPVFSEGLLQLSYQDIRGYPFCEFDWAKDKILDPKDSEKTILNPTKNLRCGVRIMAKLAKKYSAVTWKTNGYWSVLKDGGRYSKIPEIAKHTKNLPFCQPLKGVILESGTSGK